jgi:hypothetical protein
MNEESWWMTKSLGTNKINRAYQSKVEITTLESDGVSTIIIIIILLFILFK